MERPRKPLRTKNLGVGLMENMASRDRVIRFQNQKREKKGNWSVAQLAKGGRQRKEEKGNGERS